MRATFLYATAFSIIAATLVYFSTQHLPDFIPRPRPQYEPTKSARPPIAPDQSGFPPARSSGWTFDYRRDSRKYGFSEQQCLSAFPDLFVEVDRAVARRKKIGNITIEELDVVWRGDGIVRAMIHNNQLYIIDAPAVWDYQHRPRSLGTLHSIHRAITAYQDTLPDIEFTLVTHDEAEVGEGQHTAWTYCRLPEQESLWLMPDFGFWGWADVGLRSYAELVTTLDNSEDDFADKIPELVWRGGLTVGAPGTRDGLVKYSQDQPWSNVLPLDWQNKTNIDERLISMDEHCNYMFVAQTEGVSYSGRLKHLLNCNSVLVSHPLRWVEHFHHLLSSSGPEQNYVQVAQDFHDLPKKMSSMLTEANLPDAQAVAANARSVFRERYLTPAAEACYWRALIRGWSEVQGFNVDFSIEVEVEKPSGVKKMVTKPRGAPFESYVIMEAVEWEIPTTHRKLCEY